MKNTHQLFAHKTPLSTFVRQGLVALLFAVAGLVPVVAQASDLVKTRVPLSQALADAQHIAAMRRGWQVFLAKGDSMVPQINNTTLLLLASATYSELQPGMTVIYRDAVGDLVAHRVIEQTPDGWVAQGLNNGRPDPQKVTAQNLQGIVFGYVHYQEGQDSVDELAAAGAKLPQVAYAKRY